MTTFQHRTLILAVVGALTMTACGGGGSGTTSGSTSSRVTGVITGFGSVFVNGVEYETGTSTVSLEGASGSDSDLKLGMVVTLDGSVNGDGVTGTASHIEYADELEGIVSAVNITSGSGTLTVMGQTVNIDSATIFESKIVGITSVDMVAANNVVEVSGYSDGSGTIYATRVELKKAAMDVGDEIELKGVVSSLDAAAMTFTIGSQLVDYSQAQLEGMTAPANDLYVEVKSTAGIINNVLVASKVEVEGDGKKGVDGKEGDEIGLEGIVNSVLSDTEFVLNGQNVLVDTGTEFEHGSAADILAGAKLEVEGQLNAGGKVVADKISFRNEGNIEMRGFVSAIDTTASTITVMGVQIKVDNFTHMADERDENGATPVHFFSISDLAAGDMVKLHVYVDDTNALVAAQLVRDDATSFSVSLEGPVSSVNGTQVTIAGITVELAGLGLAPVIGDELEIQGDFANSLLTATSASIHN